MSNEEIIEELEGLQTWDVYLDDAATYGYFTGLRKQRKDNSEWVRVGDVKEIIKQLKK